jgi:hypothetical protein
MIPPISSHFHAMSRTASRINDGMRCMKNAPSFSQIVIPDANESSANILTNRMAQMPKILGDQ